MAESKINDILVFMSVVDTGSFIAGGKTFGLSRSTAGKTIARLEKGYGVRLLNRTTRSLNITQEGQKLYDHGIAIREAIEAADASFTGNTSVPSGTLRITAPDALGRKHILPIIQEYLHQWPEVNIVLSLSDRVDNVIEQGFDIAIRIGADLPDHSFISRTLFKDDAYLCAAPSYLKEHGHPTRIEHLTTHQILQFASQGDRQGWQLLDDDGTWVRAQGQVRIRLDNAEGLRQIALDGDGITMLPRSLIADDLVAGRLERVLPDVACGEIPIVALYPHKKFLEPRVRKLIDLFVDRLGS